MSHHIKCHLFLPSRSKIQFMLPHRLAEIRPQQNSLAKSFLSIWLPIGDLYNVSSGLI